MSASVNIISHEKSMSTSDPTTIDTNTVFKLCHGHTQMEGRHCCTTRLDVNALCQDGESPQKLAETLR